MRSAHHEAMSAAPEASAPPQFLRLAEVAKALHVSLRSVRNRLDDGSIPVVRIGGVPLVPAQWLRDLQDEALRTGKRVA